MNATLQCLVLDCPDDEVLARFYRALLGGEVNREDRRWGVGDGWSTLHLPSGVVLCFQRVAGYRPPRWPDPDHPQQAHLDLGVPDLAAAHADAVAAGAALLDDSRSGWWVYADPAGHPFCLVKESR